MHTAEEDQLRPSKRPPLYHLNAWKTQPLRGTLRSEKSFMYHHNNYLFVFNLNHCSKVDITMIQNAFAWGLLFCMLCVIWHFINIWNKMIYWRRSLFSLTTSQIRGISIRKQNPAFASVYTWNTVPTSPAFKGRCCFQFAFSLCIVSVIDIR